MEKNTMKLFARYAKINYVEGLLNSTFGWDKDCMLVPISDEKEFKVDYTQSIVDMQNFDFTQYYGVYNDADNSYTVKAKIGQQEAIIKMTTDKYEVISGNVPNTPKTQAQYCDALENLVDKNTNTLKKFDETDEFGF